MTSKNTCSHPDPRICECDFTWGKKKVFADGTKLRLSRHDHDGLSGGALNPVTSVLIRDRGQVHMKAQAGTGVMQLQATDHRAPGATRSCQG